MRFDRAGMVMGLVAGWLLVGCDGPPPAVDERAGVDGHATEVVALAYTPDGQSLVSRGSDRIKVWDDATLQERASFASDGSDFGALAVSPRRPVARRDAGGARGGDLEPRQWVGASGLPGGSSIGGRRHR